MTLPILVEKLINFTACIICNNFLFDSLLLKLTQLYNYKMPSEKRTIFAQYTACSKALKHGGWVTHIQTSYLKGCFERILLSTKMSLLFCLHSVCGLK